MRGAGKGDEFGLLVVASEEGEGDRRARAANVVVVPVVDLGWFGRVGAAQAV